MVPAGTVIRKWISRSPRSTTDRSGATVIDGSPGVGTPTANANSVPTSVPNPGTIIVLRSAAGCPLGQEVVAGPAHLDEVEAVAPGVGAAGHGERLVLDLLLDRRSGG